MSRFGFAPRQTGLSDRMPQCDKPLWHFEDYKNTRNERALSIQIDIRDMGKYFAPDSRLRSAGAFSGSWSMRGTSEHIPQRITNADDALNVMESFTFPEDIRSEARRQARFLTSVFQDVAKTVVHKDLPSGRLDRRKLPAIAEALTRGNYDPDHILPYYRRQQTPAKRPTIAIVGSAGNVEMWGDAGYIPRVTILSLAVLWACETAGLDAYAALCQGHMHPKHYKTVQLAAMLTRPGSRISPNAYAVVMHSDMWRYGFMTAQAADYDGNDKLNYVDGRYTQNVPQSVGTNFAVENGGLAVNWARTMLKADLVISIGENRDRDTADITLGSRFSIPDACAEIARQAKKLKRK